MNRIDYRKEFSYRRCEYAFEYDSRKTYVYTETDACVVLNQSTKLGIPCSILVVGL